jgi:hypothetical protein
VKRGTTPQAIDNPPKGTTAGRPSSTASSGLYAEGAGLEPKPTGWSDMTIVDRLKTPAFFTLLPATLAVKTHRETHKFKLTH